MEKYIVKRVLGKPDREVINLIKEGYASPYKEGSPESDPYFSENYVEDVESGKIRLFVCLDDKKKIGSVQYEDREGKAYLGQMTVLSGYRNKGVGGLLVSAVEESAKKEGFSVIQLTAMVEKGLPEYYEKLGYQKVGIKERPRYTLIIMEKEL
jgi:ribosomal protein S18 acetylase RimI-like enzyme